MAAYPRIDVTIMGAFGTGKTSLLTRYVDNFFEDKPLATVGTDCATVRFNCNPSTGAVRRHDPFKYEDGADGFTARKVLRIWDTAGQERFIALARSYIRQGKVFIICADGSAPLAQQCSFWFNEVRDNGRAPYKIVVVLTKADLHPPDVRASFHCAFREFVNESDNEISYFETSAKHNTGIDELFDWIARNGAVTSRTLPLQLSADDETQSGLISACKKACCG